MIIVFLNCILKISHVLPSKTRSVFSKSPRTLNKFKLILTNIPLAPTKACKRTINNRQSRYKPLMQSNKEFGDSTHINIYNISKSLVFSAFLPTITRQPRPPCSPGRPCYSNFSTRFKGSDIQMITNRGSLCNSAPRHGWNFNATSFSLFMSRPSSIYTAVPGTPRAVHPGH